MNIYIIVDAYDFFYIAAGFMRYIRQRFSWQQIHLYLVLLSVTHCQLSLQDKYTSEGLQYFLLREGALSHEGSK